MIRVVTRVVTVIVTGTVIRVVIWVVTRVVTATGTAIVTATGTVIWAVTGIVTAIVTGTVIWAVTRVVTAKATAIVTTGTTVWFLWLRLSHGRFRAPHSKHACCPWRIRAAGLTALSAGGEGWIRVSSAAAVLTLRLASVMAVAVNRIRNLS